MPFSADYKLADMLGVAGATIGIIIAGAIILGGLEAKYVGLFERYRGLTGEYRGSPGDARRHSLQTQITNYRSRIRLMNLAALGMCGALTLFVITVAIAALSVAYPGAMALRTAGTLTLLTGFVLSGAAVALNGAEVVLSRRVTLPEVEDLEDIDKDVRLMA